jgi:hypothetical protein
MLDTMHLQRVQLKQTRFGSIEERVSGLNAVN